VVQRLETDLVLCPRAKKNKHGSKEAEKSTQVWFRPRK
jgi:hypothetical protein